MSTSPIRFIRFAQARAWAVETLRSRAVMQSANLWYLDNLANLWPLDSPWLR